MKRNGNANAITTNDGSQKVHSIFKYFKITQKLVDKYIHRTDEQFAVPKVISKLLLFLEW